MKPLIGNMILLLSLIVLICALDKCNHASASQWSDEQIAAEWVWQTLNAIDTLQSIQISDNPEIYYERGIPNLIWGEHPSTVEMAGTMAAFGIIHWWLTDIIPDHGRLFGIEWNPKRSFQYFTIGISSRQVVLNFSIGLDGAD